MYRSVFIQSLALWISDFFTLQIQFALPSPDYSQPSETTKLYLDSPSLAEHLRLQAMKLGPWKASPSVVSRL